MSTPSPEELKRYAAMTLAERVALVAQLTKAEWRRSGRPWPEPIPRAQWPVRIIRLGESALDDTASIDE